MRSLVSLGAQNVMEQTPQPTSDRIQKPGKMSTQLSVSQREMRALILSHETPSRLILSSHTYVLRLLWAPDPIYFVETRSHPPCSSRKCPMRNPRPLPDRSRDNVENAGTYSTLLGLARLVLVRLRRWVNRLPPVNTSVDSLFHAINRLVT